MSQRMQVTSGTLLLVGLALHSGCVDLGDGNGRPRACGDGAVVCSSGEFCLFPDGTCQQVDRTGTCTVLPDVCIEIFAPVCGCDGVTYANDCHAWAAGVSIDHQGECA